MPNFDYQSISDAELKDIFKGVPFSVEPMRHQMLTYAHAMHMNRKRLFFMHDIGTGKTLSAIWMNQMFWKPKKILVVCPRSAFRGWRRDLDGHTD